MEFSRVGQTEEKSSMDIRADIAYGYTPLDNFSSDKNIDPILDYLKKHYSFMENAMLNSVERMDLCDGRANYKIFFKIDINMVKFIVYYEEKFKRIMQVLTFPFEMSGGYLAIPA